jgi:hypothetical protein
LPCHRLPLSPFRFFLSGSLSSGAIGLGDGVRLLQGSHAFRPSH